MRMQMRIIFVRHRRGSQIWLFDLEHPQATRWLRNSKAVVSGIMREAALKELHLYSDQLFHGARRSQADPGNITSNRQAESAGSNRAGNSSQSPPSRRQWRERLCCEEVFQTEERAVQKVHSPRYAILAGYYSCEWDCPIQSRRALNRNYSLILSPCSMTSTCQIGREI